MAKIIFKPSDLDLKDLEVFYNPGTIDIHGDTSNHANVLKSAILGGVAIMTPLSCLTANDYFTPMPANTITEPTVLAHYTKSIEDFELDIQSLPFESSNNHEKVFDEKDNLEMSTIDAYLKAVRDYYPKKKKIIL